ncbi:hypothetical protein SAMN05216304_11447 [Bosea sp. OK403]|uniref:hypothetical protein n=1 Tax=Bosea sp. OK403 TaxID=1855286 RepID=UPI0008F055F4|nr:hypothetical protein [Bosea sp. OK403]SFJ77214.1 hypothetical protein SAMN05216304_11447 [Bosea sp. OK403]
MALHKDEILDAVARFGSVAQFVGFRPEGHGLVQTYSRVAGFPDNAKFANAGEATAALLRASPDRKVNVRSYVPDGIRSREFIYGLESVEAVLEALNRLAGEGLHTIVNETIDVTDGGVSGVVQDGTVEFAPDDTPRCVEKPGVASLPLRLALSLFDTVYGFEPEWQLSPGVRLEFSLHPKPRGHQQCHTIIWEREENVRSSPMARPVWPNRFSRHIGDKAYGLLIAHLLGLPVPKTLVIGRRVAPFSFGQQTGSREVWTRTCPREPQPGLFTTVKGWVDPFRLLASEDPNHSSIASVLCQAAVRARYSGAAVTGQSSQLLIEGRRGEGDRFMLGLDGPEDLPAAIVDSVHAANEQIVGQLGPVRFEWVHDGERLWIVQLHCGATATMKDVIVPGEPTDWVDFNVSEGLNQLRVLLSGLQDGVGIRVIGEVGLTSHIADLLRKSGRPSIVSRAA